MGTDYDETKVSVTGGTFVGFNPEETKFIDVANSGQETINGVAKGYKAVDNGNGTFTVQPHIIARLHLTDPATGEAPSVPYLEGNDLAALIANGKAFYAGYYEMTLELLDDIELDEGVTIDYPMTINLSGKNITSAGDVFIVTSGANVTINGDGAVAGGASGVGSWTAVWADGGNVTINGGTYSVGGDSNASDATHQNDVIYTKNGGKVSITGGTFLNDGSVWTLNENDANRGTITVTGGTFHNWNPEDNVSEGPETNFCAQNYFAEEVSENTFVVKDYVRWVKAELLAGNDVTLDRDIVVDGTYIESIPAATNGNGRYSNFGIFNVVGDDVKFDLNGHNITYNGHANFTWKNKTYNSCTVAHGLFFANAGANLEVCDSVGNSLVTVNGVASGIYAASPNTVINVNGGSWVNKGCADCDSTNLFLYASHGGKVVISAGNFSQDLDAEGKSYLIVNHNGEYKNSAIDFSKSDITINGGTFTGMNPEEAHFFRQTADNKLVIGEIYNAVADGYIAREISENVWKVVEKVPVTVTINNVEMVIGHDIPTDQFNFTVDVEDAVVTVENYTVLDADGNVITATGEDILAGTYTITADVVAEAPYVATKVDGTLTVKLFDIVASNIVLGNELAMYFYVNIEDLDGEDYVAVVTKTYADGRDDVVAEVPYEKWAIYQYNTAQMRFRFDGIAAKEMGDNINVVIYSGSADERVQMSNAYNDCIRSYVERGFAEGKVNSDAELRTMLVDMLNYGAAAQRMFGYGLNDLANKNMAEYQQYATQSVTPVNEQEKGEGFVQTTLMLKSNLGLTMSFSKDVVTTDMTAVVTFTSHRGANRTVKITGTNFRAKGNQWCIDIGAPLVVADAAQLVTCTFLDADGNVVEGVYAKDSVASYCARALAGGGGDNYACIVKFTTSAYNYFH